MATSAAQDTHVEFLAVHARAAGLNINPMIGAALTPRVTTWISHDSVRTFAPRLAPFGDVSLGPGVVMSPPAGQSAYAVQAPSPYRTPPIHDSGPGARGQSYCPRVIGQEPRSE